MPANGVLRGVVHRLHPGILYCQNDQGQFNHHTCSGLAVLQPPPTPQDGTSAAEKIRVYLKKLICLNFM